MLHISKESKQEAVSTKQINAKNCGNHFKKWMLALEEKKVWAGDTA